MDTVGRLLHEVELELQSRGIAYTVKRTYPTRDFFSVDDETLYVIRQKIINDATYELVVAAKMRKEVL